MDANAGDSINSETKYALLSEYKPALNKFMINDLKVESFSSSHVAIMKQDDAQHVGRLY